MGVSEDAEREDGRAGEGRGSPDSPDYGETIADGSGGLPRRRPGETYGQTIADAGAAGPGSSALIGQTLGGAYETVHLIGEGGMGTVSLAKDVRLGRWVAVKRLSDPQLAERFRTEARSIGAMAHFHIVQVYAMDEDADGPYIVMEYVAGPAPSEGNWPEGLPNPPLDLEKFVKQQGCLDLDKAVELGFKLCSAVGYAHKHGIIHRDIKPANIMINEDGEPKLTDFGLARQMDSGREGMTLAGARLLTLGYGAPEQEIDASRADGRADIYAVGGTLWFVLTGDNPRLFRESEVPAALRPVLSKALQKDREKRFQTVAELEGALKAAGRSRATYEPVEREPSAAGLGVCPNCGHRHLIDPHEPLARKFCEACGGALLERCLRCDAENAVWARFCGACGESVGEAVRTKSNELEFEQDQIWLRQKIGDFSGAVQRLGQMAVIDHPRLKKFAAWAREQLPHVRGELQEQQRRGWLLNVVQGLARDRVAKVVKQATHLLGTHRYTEAAGLLRAVPTDLRTRSVHDVLRRAEANLAEIARLQGRAREHLAAKELAPLKKVVLRLLELQPGDEELTAALKRIRQAEEKRHEALWAAVVKQDTDEAYRKYLHAHPAGRHATEARRALAPGLREVLLRNPHNAEARREYLAGRTEELKAQDEDRAQAGVAIGFAMFGALGGALVGILVGGPGGFLGAVVGGTVGGLLTGLIVLGASR